MSETTETSRRPKLPEPDLEGIELAVVGADPSRKRSVGPRGPRERSKTAKAFDRLVKSAYDKWAEAGKPAKIDDCPWGIVRTKADQLENVESMLRRSATFLNVSLRMGDKTDLGNGITEVNFVARDPRPRKQSAESDSEE